MKQTEMMSYPLPARKALLEMAAELKLWVDTCSPLIKEAQALHCDKCTTYFDPFYEKHPILLRGYRIGRLGQKALNKLGISTLHADQQQTPNAELRREE